MAVDLGTDITCTDDIDPSFALSSGATQLAQALYRRIITPRGGLPDAPAYGFGASTIIDQDMTARQVAVLANSIDAEFMKDERVLSSSTTGTFANQIFVGSTLVTTAAGPFRLVLSISSVSVDLLQVTR